MLGGEAMLLEGVLQGGVALVFREDVALQALMVTQHTFQKTFQQTQTRRTTKNHRMRHTALCAAKPSPAHCSSWSTRGGSGTNKGSRGPWRRAGSRTTSHSRGSDGSIDWILQVVHQVTPVLNVIESCEKHSDSFSLLGCAVRYRPLQYFPFRKLARANVPRAAVRAHPLQHLEVPALRRHRARANVPREAVRVSPLQHLEVPALRRTHARPLAPRAPVRVCPLQHLEVSAFTRVLACRLVPGTTELAQPFEDVEFPVRRSRRAHPLVPHRVFRAQPLENHVHLLLGRHHLGEC